MKTIYSCINSIHVYPWIFPTFHSMSVFSFLDVFILNSAEILNDRIFYLKAFITVGILFMSVRRGRGEQRKRFYLDTVRLFLTEFSPLHCILHFTDFIYLAHQLHVVYRIGSNYLVEPDRLSTPLNQSSPGSAAQTREREVTCGRFES